MKRKQSTSEQRRHRATELKSVRKSLRYKGNPILKLEKQYKDFCRLREQVQSAESQQCVSLRSSDNVRRTRLVDRIASAMSKSRADE
jgi:hypothetical protein